MSFISYNLDYYETELQRLENSAVTQETIYRIKQLLKILDDLLDEGYTELNDALEESCHGVSRLRDYLCRNGADPFPVCKKRNAGKDTAYEGKEIELNHAIDELISLAAESNTVSENPFLGELACFCKWIGYEEDTAYIFLLRDTLLPYIHYRHSNKMGVHPWLLGRKTLEKLTGKAFVDDEIRASIFKTLEAEKGENYDDFCKAILPEVCTVVKKYPEIESCLTGLLHTVKEKKIIVVESGCSSTFPMLLKCLDERVDLRMYTTYPYLRSVYGDRIYTHKYENIRLFETLFSQDLLFCFSSLRENRFYVRRCCSEEVMTRAYAEVKSILD